MGSLGAELYGVCWAIALPHARSLKAVGLSHKSNNFYSFQLALMHCYVLSDGSDHIMTHVVKTYTEKQIAFLKPLLDEAKGDIRAAMTIAGYA